MRTCQRGEWGLHSTSEGQSGKMSHLVEINRSKEENEQVNLGNLASKKRGEEGNDH